MNDLYSAIARAGTASIAALAIAVCATPAFAVDGPPDGPPGPPPPESVPSYATGDEAIHGRIASIDGKYQIQVHDDRGFVDNVTLHDGTVIYPTGLRLSPGQTVTIRGHNVGKTFEANEIDTPYGHYWRPYAYGYPRYAYPVYPVYPYAYAYPRYGYPYGPYGYYPYYRGYPAFGLGFHDRGFGLRAWF